MAGFAFVFAGSLRPQPCALVIMSQQAYESLTLTQITLLEKYNQLVYADLKTIETNGGGSARCMIAEVF